MHRILILPDTGIQLIYKPDTGNPAGKSLRPYTGTYLSGELVRPDIGASRIFNFVFFQEVVSLTVLNSS
jgi:hypothetical protein